MTLQEQMLKSGYDSGDPVRKAAAIAAGYVPPGQLSGTGNPSPNPAPLPTNTPDNTPALPSGTSPSKLVTFANSLNAAVELARQHRNELSVGMMKPFQGTVAASDFDSILGNLNAASDKTSSDLVDTANKSLKPDTSNIVTATSDNGDVHGIDKTTGQLLWTVKGVGNQQGGSSDVLTHSGALTYTKQDYSSDASALEQSRGADGWVDPTIYQKLYDSWVSNGGKIADFVKTYPPEQYVNPANDWLPVYLRPKKSGVSNPFAQ